MKTLAAEVGRSYFEKKGMFTGLIEAVCSVRSVVAAPAGRGKRLQVALGDLATDTQVGDSIAINGVCLTVSAIAESEAWFDVSPESLQRSTLGTLQSGQQVNAERALRVGDRLGGHFVQGHIDGVGTITSVHRQGDFWDFTFSPDRDLVSQLVPKGSVAIDGVSLTVATLNTSHFTVAVIPETARQTTLSQKRRGDKVNLETDILMKAVRRTCETLIEQNRPMSVDTLKTMGF
jgi:riboflavin synthase